MSHDNVSVCIHDQGNVCHPASCGEEPILQNAPSPSEACQEMTSDKPRSKVLVSLICNQAKLFPPSTSGMSPGTSGCFPWIRWGSTGVQIGKEPRVDTVCTSAWLTVGLGNSNHMVLWRPCHAWRAQVLFLSNKISDYSQAESDMACLVTLDIFLRDSLTQNSGCDLSLSQLFMHMGMAVCFLQF